MSSIFHIMSESLAVNIYAAFCSAGRLSTFTGAVPHALCFSARNTQPLNWPVNRPVDGLASHFTAFRIIVNPPSTASTSFWLAHISSESFAALRQDYANSCASVRDFPFISLAAITGVPSSFQSIAKTGSFQHIQCSCSGHQ